MSGAIIVLHGASCSGKTSLAKALQEVLDEPYLHVGLDHFEAMQPVQGGRRVHAFYGQGIAQPDLLPVLHQCVASFAAAGVGVILEHIFLEPRWLRDAVARLHGYDVLFVGVHCPPEELARREAAREGRDLSSGQAVRQFHALEHLRERNPFDLVVDTTAATPEDLAARIKARPAEGSAPTAFRRLWAEPIGGDDAAYGPGMPSA